MGRAGDMLRASVRVEASSAQPEKLLNALAESGVGFSGAESVDGCTLRLTLPAAALGEARRLAVRSQCELRVLHRTGAPAFRRRARRRMALMFSLALCFALLAASSLFVWDIEVTGNEDVSDGEILRVLEDAGVGYGSFWPGWEADRIKNEVILAVPELSWVGVTVAGSRAVGEVRERVERPELIDNDAPCAVTAAETGIIVRMDVDMGAPAVQPGDAVLRGEELVSSLMTSPVGETRQVHAQADVTARTWYELTASAPLSELTRGDEGRSYSRWALAVGKTRLNFYRDSGKMDIGCDKIIKEYPLAVEGVFALPVKLIRETYTEYEPVYAEAEREALEARLRAALAAELERRLGAGGEVLSESFSAAESGGALLVTLRAECLQNIAVETPLAQ